MPVKSMAKRLLLTAALTSVLMALLAQSPPPPPSPSKAAEVKQDERNAVDNKSQNTTSPAQIPTATVNPTTPQPTEKAAQKKSTPNRKVSATNNWINWRILNVGLLTLVNVLLVIVGFLQWRSMHKQSGYMRDGLQETRRTVEAAKDSAKAATNAIELTEHTDRAVVVLESVRASTSEYIGAETVIIFTLKNFGETVARFVKLTGDLITTIGKDFLRDTPEVTLAPQGVNQWITRSLRIGIEEKYDYVIKAMNTNEGDLRYKIEVFYWDVFSKHHTYKAEGHYVPLLKAFINTSSDSD